MIWRSAVKDFYKKERQIDAINNVQQIGCEALWRVIAGVAHCFSVYGWMNNENKKKKIKKNEKMLLNDFGLLINIKDIYTVLSSLIN